MQYQPQPHIRVSPGVTYILLSPGTTTTGTSSSLPSASGYTKRHRPRSASVSYHQPQTLPVFSAAPTHQQQYVPAYTYVAAPPAPVVHHKTGPSATPAPKSSHLPPQTPATAPISIPAVSPSHTKHAHRKSYDGYTKVHHIYPQVYTTAYSPGAYQQQQYHGQHLSPQAYQPALHHYTATPTSQPGSVSPASVASSISAGSAFSSGSLSSDGSRPKSILKRPRAMSLSAKKVHFAP